MPTPKSNPKKALDIFANVSRETIRRNSQRSVTWMMNKIKSAKKKDMTRTVPKIGGMYLYVYDAKTKDKLPFWDASPLVIPVKFEKGGFSGLNFHYIPLAERLALFNILAGMRSNTSKRYIRISYERLLSLSNGYWKFAYKRYLYTHLRTKLLVIEKDEWKDALMLPVANFQKKTQTFVHKKFRGL